MRPLPLDATSKCFHQSSQLENELEQRDPNYEFLFKFRLEALAWSPGLGTPAHER